jgi:hypothetical protein
MEMWVDGRTDGGTDNGVWMDGKIVMAGRIDSRSVHIRLFVYSVP